MKTTKILSLLTALVMLLSFAACGTAKGNTTNTTANKKSETAMLTAVNPKTKDEAADLHQKLMAQENAILSENSKLWEKVFASADKGMAMNEDGKNYGDFLLKTIDGIKEQAVHWQSIWRSLNCRLAACRRRRDFRQQHRIWHFLQQKNRSSIWKCVLHLHFPWSRGFRSGKS